MVIQTDIWQSFSCLQADNSKILFYVELWIKAKTFGTWILNKTKPKHQLFLISSKMPKIAQFPYFH